MMKRTTRIVMITLVGFGLIGVVGAKQFDTCERGPMFGEGQRGDWMAKRISRKLDLNEPQEIALGELKISLLNSFDSMRAQKLVASDIQSILNTELDQEKALQLVDQRILSVQQNAPELIAAFAAFYNQLESNQQSEVSEMIEYRMQHKGSRRGHGPFSREH